MLTSKELKALLKAEGLRLSKRWGQHHLVDAPLIRRTVDSWRLSQADTVVEIGAGLGALTEELAAHAKKVVAVELDPRISELLRQRMESYANIEVRCVDILKFPWETLREEESVKVVGAIPYNITSPILIALGEHRDAFTEAILIVQREVALRLIAKPGESDYGRLTLYGNYCWNVRLGVSLSASAFFPQPKVDSVCIHLLTRRQPAAPEVDETYLFDLIKAAFAHRRKTLLNCWSGKGTALFERQALERALTALKLPTDVRGEALSLDQFASLAKTLKYSR